VYVVLSSPLLWRISLGAGRQDVARNRGARHARFDCTAELDAHSLDVLRLSFREVDIHLSLNHLAGDTGAVIEIQGDSAVVILKHGRRRKYVSLAVPVGLIRRRGCTAISLHYTASSCGTGSNAERCLLWRIQHGGCATDNRMMSATTTAQRRALLQPRAPAESAMRTAVAGPAHTVGAGLDHSRAHRGFLAAAPWTNGHGRRAHVRRRGGPGERKNLKTGTLALSHPHRSISARLPPAAGAARPSARRSAYPPKRIAESEAVALQACARIRPARALLADQLEWTRDHGHTGLSGGERVSDRRLDARAKPVGAERASAQRATVRAPSHAQNPCALLSACRRRA
jgi:hypothetical protein